MKFQVGDWVIVAEYATRKILPLVTPGEVIEIDPTAWKCRVTWPHWTAWYGYEVLRRASPLELLAAEAE